MFWNKSDEKKGLPDLPEYNPPQSSIPSFRENSEENNEYSEMENQKLPSFPDSPMQQGFSQAAIKDAVTTSEQREEIEEEAEMSSFAPKPSYEVVEMEDWAQSSAPSPRLISSSIPSPREIGSEMEYSPSFKEPKIVKSPAEIYVKIDKFVSAKRSVQSIQEKIEEIDELLRKIRETKLREDQDLASWEKEMIEIKTHIQKINENIFEKL